MLLVTILIGWGLALVRLGERSLWADEGSTVYQAQRITSLADAAELHKGYHLLHFSLMMIVVRLSQSEMILRFPSAMATILALPVVYALGCRLLGRTAGLVGMFLLAISPFAIGYAQEARVYAMVELFACLSLLLLLLALDRGSWYWWVGFALGTSLLLYTHFFAWFVVGAEILFAFLVLLRKAVRERRFDPCWLGFAACLLFLVVSYLPLLPPLLAFWELQRPGAASSGNAALASFQLSVGFFRTMASAYGPHTYGWPLNLFVAILSLGLLSLIARKRWNALLLVTLWLAVPVTILSLVRSQHHFDYRYLIFIMPILLLVVAEGISAVTSLLLRQKTFADQGWIPPLLTLGLAAVLFVPANYQALQTHYRSEKENWRGIGAFVREYLQDDEAICVSPRLWANPLMVYQPSLEPFLVNGAGLMQLRNAVKEHDGLWFMRHESRLGDPTGQLTIWLNNQQFELLIDSKACGWGIYVYYRRFDDQASARQADLLRRAAIFCPTDPRFRSPADPPSGE
jgi:hypothetical protein